MSGRLTLTKTSVDVAELVDLALESVRLAADARGVALERKVDPGLGRIVGDPDRLRQVVWNLLANAIKFSARGGRVTVTAAAEPAGDVKDGHVTITVEDRGHGIDPEFLPYVFERFRQADASTARTSGGLGLGLAIARHLVELHGGDVSAWSEGLGRGATFRVRLPRTLVATENVPGAAPSRRDSRPADPRWPAELTGRRALVIDDDADARELIKAMLERCGMEVAMASSSADGREALSRQLPDVIVCDIGMPVEDGLSFIRGLRAMTREQGARVPAVALTAYARHEERTHALLAGFSHHVRKPVDVDELLAVLASVLRSAAA